MCARNITFSFSAARVVLICMLTFFAGLILAIAQHLSIILQGCVCVLLCKQIGEGGDTRVEGDGMCVHETLAELLLVG